MGESVLHAESSSTEIGGHFRSRPDKIVRRKFGAVAKLIWDKPDAAIASIAKVDPRTGRRILRGEVDVPASVVLAACEEMLRSLD